MPFGKRTAPPPPAAVAPGAPPVEPPQPTQARQNPDDATSVSLWRQLAPRLIRRAPPTPTVTAVRVAQIIPASPSATTDSESSAEQPAPASPPDTSETATPAQLQSTPQDEDRYSPEAMDAVVATDPWPADDEPAAGTNVNRQADESPVQALSNDEPSSAATDVEPLALWSETDDAALSFELEAAEEPNDRAGGQPDQTDDEVDPFSLPLDAIATSAGADAATMPVAPEQSLIPSLAEPGLPHSQHDDAFAARDIDATHDTLVLSDEGEPPPAVRGDTPAMATSSALPTATPGDDESALAERHTTQSADESTKALDRDLGSVQSALGNSHDTPPVEEAAMEALDPPAPLPGDPTVDHPLPDSDPVGSIKDEPTSISLEDTAMAVVEDPVIDETAEDAPRTGSDDSREHTQSLFVSEPNSEEEGLNPDVGPTEAMNSTTPSVERSGNGTASTTEQGATIQSEEVTDYPAAEPSMPAALDSAPDDDEDLRHHFLSYLVLERPARVTAMDVVAASILLTKDQAILVEPIDTGPLGDTAVALAVNGQAVVIMMVDDPLPPDAWEPAARRASWNAGPALAEGYAHAVIALIDAADTHAKALNGAAAVTIVLAALAAILPAKAAVFTEAETVQKPSVLADHVRHLLEGQIPIPLWVGLALTHAEPSPEGARRISVSTTGLRPFAGREIEFLPTSLDPMEVGRRIIGLAAYLVGNGPVIRDGDTVGMSNDERIAVTYADEGSRPGVPVMLLSVSG